MYITIYIYEKICDLICYRITASKYKFLILWLLVAPGICSSRAHGVNVSFFDLGV